MYTSLQATSILELMLPRMSLFFFTTCQEQKHILVHTRWKQTNYISTYIAPELVTKFGLLELVVEPHVNADVIGRHPSGLDVLGQRSIDPDVLLVALEF